MPSRPWLIVAVFGIFAGGLWGAIAYAILTVVAGPPLTYGLAVCVGIAVDAWVVGFLAAPATEWDAQRRTHAERTWAEGGPAWFRFARRVSGIERRESQRITEWFEERRALIAPLPSIETSAVAGSEGRTSACATASCASRCRRGSIVVVTRNPPRLVRSSP